MSQAPEEIHTISAFLERFPYLDLTGRVVLGPMVGLGGFSDVYCGTFENEGQKLAIKRIRVFMDEDRDFERVCSLHITKTLL